MTSTGEGHRVRRCVRRLAWTGLWTLVMGNVAAEDCRDEWICVDALDQGGNVELRARNLREYPVTYTFRLVAGSISFGSPRTVTSTLGARQSEPVMVLSHSGVPDYDYTLKWTVGDKDAVHDETHLYALPYASGKAYRVIQGYGSTFSHTGLEEFAVDFDMPVGTPVHAARSGTVARVQVSNSRGCWQDGCGRYANFIVVLHPDGTTGEYYHLMQDGAVVEVGDTVMRGQIIGYSGNTGHTTMPHLHFAVYRATTWGNTQSIPVRFQGVEGIIDRPRRGARYEAT